MITLIFILLALLGALSTYLLAQHKRFDAIRASALVTIFAYGLLRLFSDNPDLYALVFFGGTFIGMSAPHRFGFYTLTSSAIIFAPLFQYLVPKLNGYGGALGLSAFMAICVCHVAILLGAPRSIKKPPGSFGG